MRKSALSSLLLIIWIVLASCSVTHTVNTKPIQALEKDLIGTSTSVESLKVTFSRPQVTFRINISEEPASEILDMLVNKVKMFSSVANMDLIAKKVNWDDHIWRVSIIINTDKDAQTAEHQYTAEYYKTSNDQSTQNVDAYQTWHIIK